MSTLLGWLPGFVLPAFHPPYSRFIAQYRRFLSDPATGHGAIAVDNIRLSCHVGRTFVVFDIPLVQKCGLATLRVTLKVK